MSIQPASLTAQEWHALHRCDDGEQQPISPVEREFGMESHGKRHGLELIRGILRAWGEPQLRYPTIHVAGSKGKGSTVAVLASILRAAGYRVGAYTSPSLTHFGERIQVDGRSMSDGDAERGVAALLQLSSLLPERPRFFEAATAIAFRYFAEQSVDIAVVEVGLGGRLDATNVVQPEVGVITSIELEHTHILGNCLAAIAAEKAGIVKERMPTVSGVTDAEPREVIERICRERQSALVQLGTDFRVMRAEPGITRQRIDLWMGPGLGGELASVTVGLPGDAQCGNAALAVAALRLLGDRWNRLSEAAIRRGLAEVRWPGRLEWIAAEPDILLDVAHTPASAAQLRLYLDRFFAGRPKTLVIGVLRDKKVDEIAARLAGAFDRVIVAPIKWFRSMQVEALREALERNHGRVEAAGSIAAATRRALEVTPRDGLVVVGGSLFAVGEAKRRFGW